MFKQPRYRVSQKLDEEFSKPVESIMRCEDFKSNFARRLSNRYISKSPSIPSSKQESALKLCLLETSKIENVPEKIPERTEPVSQPIKKYNVEQNGETFQVTDKPPLKNFDFRTTEVTVLNMEVETLRWQLTQTEANRQMHIALLTQIVTFLNKVKEHIQVQKKEAVAKKEIFPENFSPRPFKFTDLPRSKSVVHVNKNLDYSLPSPKKISTRKISKSISNVTGYRDCNGVWSPSKLSLTPETEQNQKITEEITRLITLATTVLSTNLPDLACSCNDITTNLIGKQPLPKRNESNTFEVIKDPAFVLNTNTDGTDTCNGITTTLIEANNKKLSDFIMPHSTIARGIENDFVGVKLHEKELNHSLFSKNDCDLSNGKIRKTSIEKRNDYNLCNFVEDESGFSSMNSFQEIGIPIISIIPPSPCKEMGYLDIEDIPENMSESEKWKKNTIELDKQAVKLFWV